MLANASTNIVNSVIFNKAQSKVFFVGQTKSLMASTLNTFTKDVGFVMQADYASTLLQNQCIQLTVSYGASVLLTKTSLSFDTKQSVSFQRSTGVSVLSDTTTTVRTLISMSLIDQSTWCGASTVVTFTGSPFTPQVYNVGTSGQLTTFPFSNFAINPPCTDAVYSYSAAMSTTGAVLPTFLVFDAIGKSFTWSAATAANAGTYDVDVTCTLNNGKKQVYVFSLTINACSAAVISTAGNTIIPIQYPQIGAPYTITFTPFTSNLPVATCGSITYSMSGPVVIGGPLDSSFLYSFNQATLQLVINCNMCQMTFPTHTLRLTGSQSGISNYIEFDVIFTNGCLIGQNISPPPQTISLTYKVNDPAIAILITGFKTAIVGCESQLIYSCPQCTSSVLFTFTLPNSLSIQASGNNAVGLNTIQVYSYISTQGTVYQTIDVTVSPDCNTVSIDADQIANTTYDISEGIDKIIAAPQWNAGEYTACKGLIVYTLIDLDTNLAFDSTIFKMTQDPIITILKTTDLSKVRLQNFKLTGAIGSTSIDTIFSVLVTNQCASALPVQEIIPDQSYAIGMPALTIDFPQWKDSLGANKCGVITYTANVDNKMLDSAWIKFDGKARKFLVQTSNLQKQGVHTVKVIAQLTVSSRISISTFQLTLLDPCADAQVIASNLASDLQYQATASTTHPEVQYAFTKWKDNKGGKCEPIFYQVSGVPGPNMTATFSLEVHPAESLLILKLSGPVEIPSTLDIIIVGSLKNGNSTSVPGQIKILTDPILNKLQSTSLFKFDPSLQDKLKTMKSDLQLRIKSIDTKGNVVLQFSKPLMEVTNLTIIEERKAISFSISGQGASQAKIVSWKINDWNKNFIRIQLFISNAQQLSLGENQDQLKVVIKEAGFFRSSDASSTIQVNSGANMKFPPQQANTTFAKTFDQVTEGAKSVLSGTLGVNFLVSLIFGASMSNMWQLMNIIQIITMMPVLKIPYSSMYVTTTDILRTLAQFEILPEWLSFKGFREKVLGVTSFDDFTKFNPLVTTNQTKRFLEAFNSTSEENDDGPNLNAIGIESSSVMMNLGSIGDMIIGILFLSLFIQLLKLSFNCFPIFRYVYNFFAVMLFFNSYIQASNQGYLYFSIIAFHSAVNYSTTEKTVDKVLSIVMMVYILTYPLFVLIYMCKKQPQIDKDESITKSTGSLFELVHTNHGRGQTLVSFVFLIRRLLLGASFYFISQKPQLQIMTILLSSFGILFYQCLFKPFVTRQDTFFEFYNEATLLGLSYCLLTSLVVETRVDAIDTGIVVLIISAIALNFCNFIYSSYRDMRHTCLKAGYKFRKFWHKITTPKTCCCAQAGSTNKCSQHTKTLKIAPTKDQSSKNLDFIQTEERLMVLERAISKATKINPNAQFVVVDLQQLKIKSKKKVVKIISEESVESETMEEKAKISSLLDEKQSQVKETIIEEFKQKERMKILENKAEIQVPKMKTSDTKEFWDRPEIREPRKMSISISSVGASENQVTLPRLDEEVMREFKISTAGILQDIDQISLENENKDLIAVNPSIKQEIKEGKEKLMLIKQLIKK